VTAADAEQQGGGAEDGPPAGVPSTAVLPDAVRRAMTDLAARVLGELPEAAVPGALRRVRAFAPARRPRAGAGPLATALDRDAGFRQAVAAAWRLAHADLAAASEVGPLPPGTDPLDAAVGAFLLRPPDWPAHLATWLDALAGAQVEALRREEEAGTRSQAEASRREAERWREEAERYRRAMAAAEEELVQLRREQRRLRAEADRARAAARAAEQDLDRERAATGAATAELGEVQRQSAELVRQARADVEAARREAREGRSLASVRARLLLDTVVEAAAGLRRELALPPATLRPADTVAEAVEGDVVERSVRARAEDDPSALDELLLLPRSHLIVDGYNVTKAGFGGLPLVDQRRRLVDGLTAMCARTGAEITCCFDGAEVESRPAVRVRGVRVLFSHPGQTADELIIRLVRAEPPGRVIVVVSSDAEVAAGVRAAAARALPATALLRLLARG